jgi:hypothetical protein
VLDTAGDGARPEVRRRTHVADGACSRERPQERRVFDGPDAVRDPHGLEEAKRVRDGLGSRPLARVHDGKEARPPSAAERLGEIARGEGRLVAAEPEADDARPRPLGLEIEDARGGRGAPVPDEVEKDTHAPAPVSLVVREGPLEGLSHVEPVEPDFLHDRRRDVDLGPAHVLPREARHEAARRKAIVGGAVELPADVAVEAEKGLRRPERPPARAHGGQIGEDGPRRAGRQANEGRRRDRSFEV